MPFVSSKIIWLMLLAGPVLFLLAFIASGTYFAQVARLPTQEIPERVAMQMPQILAGVLATLAILLLVVASDAVTAAWRTALSAPVARPVFVGIAFGSLLAAFYLLALTPALSFAQSRIGDYVPAGSVLSTVSANLPFFLLANVLLAPLVEETLYRGLAIDALTPGFGVVAAALISCLGFGLLHWPGGFWYMLITGLIAGGVFSALLVWQQSLLSPLAAHMTLNLIEFAYAALKRGA